METYQVSEISEHMSFLEMMDVLNERLITEGKEPVAFDHDCEREFVVRVRCTSTVNLMDQTRSYDLSIAHA